MTNTIFGGLIAGGKVRHVGHFTELERQYCQFSTSGYALLLPAEESAELVERLLYRSARLELLDLFVCHTLHVGPE
jgi:hypothetical protein